MNEVDLAVLNEARTLRMLTERDGELVAEVTLEAFTAAGDSAHSTFRTPVRGDIGESATWAELVDEGGDIIAVGLLATRSAERSD